MDAIYTLIDTILPFDWTAYTFMKNALLAVLLITPLFGLVGTVVVSNHMSFFSDALGHCALTGIAVGVMMGIDNYMISMMGFALLFALCISAVLETGTSSADTVIGVFSATGMALGIVLLSAFGGFSKYSAYLVGDILTVQPAEIALLLGVLVVVLILWVFFYNSLLLTGLNEDLAAGKKIHVKFVSRLFSVIVAVIVTISIKWVGILIINSLLVLPAASARNVAGSSRGYIGYSVLFSMIAGISGLILSYELGTSAGGTIVLVSAVLFFLSWLWGRCRRGVR